MSTVSACVLVFAAKATGAGDQEFDDVVIDGRTGDLFIPTGFWFLSANATLETANNPNYNYGFNVGVENGVVGSIFGSGDSFQFGGKICSAVGGGRYSLCDNQPQAFFGGANFRRAYVSATRLGGFTITYDQNDRTGDYIIGILTGGDVDLSFPVLSNGANAVSANPQGLFNIGSLGVSASKGAAVGAGGGPLGFGVAANGSGQFGTGTQAFNQGGNYREQSDAAFTVLSGPGAIDAWGGSSLTVSGLTTTTFPALFSGALVKCACGTEIQPVPTGEFTIPTGVDANIAILISVGAVAGAGSLSDCAEVVIGVFDGAQQASLWSGEDVVGNGIPLRGARYLSAVSALRFTETPTGTTTTFGSEIVAVALESDGTLRLRCDSSDGVLRQFAWWVMGVAPTPPPAALRLTQLPLVVAYPYPMVAPLATGDGVEWVTPPPTRSRRGR